MLNISIIFINKKFNWYKIFAVNTLIVILGLLSVIIFKIFPDCYIEGYGLTIFKKLSEYIIAMDMLFY